MLSAPPPAVELTARARRKESLDARWSASRLFPRTHDLQTLVLMTRFRRSVIRAMLARCVETVGGERIEAVRIDSWQSQDEEASPSLHLTIEVNAPHRRVLAARRSVLEAVSELAPAASHGERSTISVSLEPANHKGTEEIAQGVIEELSRLAEKNAVGALDLADLKRVYELRKGVSRIIDRRVRQQTSREIKAILNDHFDARIKKFRELYAGATRLTDEQSRTYLTLLSYRNLALDVESPDELNQQVTQQVQSTQVEAAALLKLLGIKPAHEPIPLSV